MGLRSLPFHISPPFLTVWNCDRHPGYISSHFPSFLTVRNCDRHPGYISSHFPAFFNSVELWSPPWIHPFQLFRPFFKTSELWSSPWIHSFELSRLFLTVWTWDHISLSFFNSAELWSSPWMTAVFLTAPLSFLFVIREVQLWRIRIRSYEL
jgi:hypothetical protein